MPNFPTVCHSSPWEVIQWHAQDVHLEPESHYLIAATFYLLACANLTTNNVGKDIAAAMFRRLSNCYRVCA